MDLLTVTLILVSTVLLFYHYAWKSANHFEKLGVPHKRPLPFLGNMAPVMLRRINIETHIKNFYYQFANAKYFGFYTFGTPIVAIRDPELVTSIAIKNFDHFVNHQVFVDPDIDPLMGKNLLSLKGDRWREMRRLLSPAFTSSKMKSMFKLMCNVAERFVDFVASESKEGKAYDLKNIFARYTNDVVATCSFGYNVDSMRDPDNQFYAFSSKAFTFTTIMLLKALVAQNFPILAKLFGTRIFSEKSSRYFFKIIEDTVKMREEKGIHRPDMIQLMMESGEKDGKGLTIEEMTCQAFIFFFGGFDTTSNTLSFAAHEIGVNPDIQARLREEIEEVLENTNGKPTYEAIMNMPYLDALVNETLRRHPVAVVQDRVCVKSFELPPTTPDSKPVTLKPGDVVWFLTYGYHMDPNYFPDPADFRPERFLNGEVTQSVPYLPFGTGPRMCIGNRFALMAIKVLVFHLLLRCELEPCAKTPIPMVFSKKLFGLVPENELRMNFKARENQVQSKEHTNEYRNGSAS